VLGYLVQSPLSSDLAITRRVFLSNT
jgi:hypothetical protein